MLFHVHCYECWSKLALLNSLRGWTMVKFQWFSKLLRPEFYSSTALRLKFVAWLREWTEDVCTTGDPKCQEVSQHISAYLSNNIISRLFASLAPNQQVISPDVLRAVKTGPAIRALRGNKRGKDPAGVARLVQSRWTLRAGTGHRW